MELSVYHNIIVTTTSSSSSIYIFDYEYLSLKAKLTFEGDHVITALQILEEYPIMVIGTSSGLVLFLYFKIGEENSISIDLIGKIHLFRSLLFAK